MDPRTAPNVLSLLNHNDITPQLLGRIADHTGTPFPHIKHDPDADSDSAPSSSPPGYPSSMDIPLIPTRVIAALGQAHHVQHLLEFCAYSEVSYFQTRSNKGDLHPTVTWTILILGNDNFPLKINIKDHELPWNLNECKDLFRVLFNHHSGGQHRWHHKTFLKTGNNPLWHTHPFLKNLFHYVRPVQPGLWLHHLRPQSQKRLQDSISLFSLCSWIGLTYYFSYAPADHDLETLYRVENLKWDDFSHFLTFDTCANSDFGLCTK